MRRERCEEVNVFAALFHGRQDAFGLMQRGQIAAVRRPVSLLHYRLHLEGKLRLGIYPLLSDGTTSFLVFDFDGPEAQARARQVFHCAEHFDLPLAWEISKSGDAHLWLFFSSSVSARAARLVGRMLLDDAGVQAELFPKQDALPERGLGNFIWLPLSGESVRQGRTLFVDPVNLLPYPDQRAFLSAARTVDPELLGQLVDVNGLKDEAFKPSHEGPRIFSGDLLPCAKRMLEGVTEGRRDMAAFRLAIHLKSRGYTVQEAEEVLHEWNATKNRPPLPPRVITLKVRSAFLRGYSGYGCEDPLILPFCDEACPIKQKMLSALLVAEEKAR